MPWRETCAMDERMCFIAAALERDVSMAELCRGFGISRKTGYKWLGRYRAEGGAGLADHSRRPHGNSRAVPSALIEPILEVRRRHPSWGPRKAKAWLTEHHPGQAWPAASTIGSLYDRAGLTVPRKRRRRTPPETLPLTQATAPNDVWCIDFKGWFLTGDGTQVDPLTLTDAHSRYLLQCRALGRPDEAHVWPQLERTFHAVGLPRVLRSDNGPPFASTAVAGLSRLAVKLIKTGIRPERIALGKPHQNGAHERMHLTLKQETASPPARTLAEQIARFDAFQETYNQDRPHEALGQIPPARLWIPSARVWDGRLRSPDYGQGIVVRRVRSNGEIKWQGRTLFLSHALCGEPVGLGRIGEQSWLIHYGPLLLATLTSGHRLTRVGQTSTTTAQQDQDRNTP